MRTNDLTIGKESKVIFQFALPMLLGNVFQQLYNVVDSIIVGNILGKKALAAVGASFPVIFTLIALVFGIGIGFSIIVAQYFGAKDIERVKRTIDTMYISLFFASIAITIIGITFNESIFRILKLPEEVLPLAKTYLNVYFSGTIFLFGFNGTSSILRGLGDSKTPLYFLILSTLVNIGLDLLFIIVFKWGIAGAAYATIISQGIAFISAIIYLNKTHKIIHFSLRDTHFDKNIFKKSIKIGLPSGIQQTFVSIGMMALFGIINTFGTDVIAAYTAAGRINSLALMPAMNFAAALSTFTGQNLGAGKGKRVKSGYKATLLMSSLLCIVVTVIIIYFGGFLMSLFTSDSEVIRIGTKYLVIVSSFYLLFSTMFVTNGVIRGAGATLIPMFITLFSLWLVRLPVAYFLSQKIGVTGIWWSIPIGWFFGMIGALIYYMSGKWKNKVIIEHEIKAKG